MRQRLDMTPGAFRAIVFLLVLSLFLFAVNLVFTSREVAAARTAAAAAAHSTASVVQLCQLGNESRAQQVLLWEHLIQVSTASPPPGETPAQQRKRAATARGFIAYVKHIFAPRNCARQF